jgi:5-methylcytosine-specific restriction protein A
MPYAFRREDATLIESLFDVRDGQIILHARGGARGTKSSRNPEYHEGLVELVTRLSRSPFSIDIAYVDSSRVQSIGVPDRTVMRGDDAGTAEELATLIERRAKAVGRLPGAKGAGNGTKRICFTIASSPTKAALVAALGAVPVDHDARSVERLPADMLQRVNATHVFDALEELRSRPVEDTAFGQSTDYDVLLEDGATLPPKAVFGLAASKALGFEVLPRHFSGGVDTICFRKLEACGLTIVEKGSAPDVPDDVAVPLTEEDRVWIEGKLRLVTHLRRERRRGLSAAKRQAFREANGRLYCERCGFDPVSAYGTEMAEACLEVHHSRVAVADMEQGHETALEDTQLLCANCHRLVHREMKV